MGKGGAGLSFLNKKTWHPGRMQNQERLWKAEEEAAAEARSLEELRKKIAEERAREDLKEAAISGGHQKAASRIDWMYSGGVMAKAEADKRNEDGMLGLAPIEAETGKQEASRLEEATLLPSFYAEDTPAAANETWARLHSDPLFAIRQQEQSARKQVIAKPLQMQAIKKQVQALRDAAAAKKAAKKAAKEERKAEKHAKKERKAEKAGKTGSATQSQAVKPNGVAHDAEQPPPAKRQKRSSSPAADVRHRDEERRRRYAGDAMQSTSHSAPQHDTRAVNGHHEQRQRSERAASDRRSDRHDTQSNRRDHRSDRHDTHSDRHDRRSDRHDSHSDGRDYQSDRHDRRSDRHDKRSDRFEKRSDSHDKRPDSHDTRSDRHVKRSDRHDRRSDRHDRQIDESVKRSEEGTTQHDKPRSEQHKAGDKDGASAQGPGLQYGLTANEHQDSDRSAHAAATQERLKAAEHAQQEADRAARLAQGQRRSHTTGRLTSEEKAARLAEMTGNAVAHEGSRSSRLKQAASKDAAIRAAEAISGSTAHHSDTQRFVTAVTKDVYGSGAGGGTLEDRVARRSYYNQRGVGSTDRNAFRRN